MAGDETNAKKPKSQCNQALRFIMATILRPTRGNTGRGRFVDGLTGKPEVISRRGDLRHYFRIADHTRRNYLESAVVSVMAIYQQLSADTALLIVSRRFLELGVVEKIVLNPQLRPGLSQKHIHGNSGGSRLILIEVEIRHAVQRALLWIVIKIAAQQNASRLCQFQVQHLVPLRVSGGPFDDDSPIAEYIAVFIVNDGRFCAAKACVG